MTRNRISLYVALFLLLGSGFWWWQRARPAGELGEREPARAQHAFERGSEPSGGLGEALAGSVALASVEGGWQDRYPDARVVESRVVSVEAGRFSRQYLLATASERIPWVVWEDKVGLGDAGAFEAFGTVAKMGNVFLVEADPLLLPTPELDAFLIEHDLFVERRSKVSNYLCLGFENPRLGKIEALLAAFAARFPGALAEFDVLSYPSATPRDWDGSRMWGLDVIEARDAWQFESGRDSSGVVVAIIDTGMQRVHPDLAPNLFVNPGDRSLDGIDDDGNGLVDDVSGWDFADNDADPNDVDGHGTHVAGIAGARGDNAGRAVGVNWQVRLLPLKVGDADGLRNSAINDALAYVGALKTAGINIVATNNSYGSGSPSASTRNEIAKHRNLGILFVAAAGNDGRNIDAASGALEYPAGYTLENIISVGSSNDEDALNPSSNYGSVSVDISAPGNDIYSTYLNGSYAFLSGTSMASPMVAGAVGLLAQDEPALTWSQLKTRLLESGDLSPSQLGLTATGRRLNLLAALRPGLADHSLEVVNAPDAIVLLDAVGARADFRASANPSASVSAAVVAGSEVGRIEPLGSGVFRFTATGGGHARVRFESELDGLVRTLEKSVFVGDPPAPPGSGLLHRFAFDGAGSREEDLGGSSDGTLVGATRESGAYGSSLRLDNASERMSFEGRFSNRVTIAALVRSDNLSSSPHPRIVNMPFYYLYFSSGSAASAPDGNRQTLKFFSNQSNFGVWNTPSRTIEDDRWYYVVGTYDSSSLLNTPTLYLNGQSQAVRIQQEPSGAMQRPVEPSYVGNNGDGDRAFNGLIADVRVYDRELSQSEVRELGAWLGQSRWQDLAFSGPSSARVGEAVSFRILDSGSLATGLAVDWYLEGEAGELLLQQGGTDGKMSFGITGRHTLVASASDGISTRFFSAEIDVGLGELSPGVYQGASSGGGFVWLEVADSRSEGRVSVYDLASGFYRIRESVAIGSDGSFRTAGSGKGSVSGSVSSLFLGSVSGYGIEFEGELLSEASSGSAFEGDYVGGVVLGPGERVTARVLPDGRALLWREGPGAAIGEASIDLAGSVSGVDLQGGAIGMQFDASAGSISGTWGADPVFLKAVGLPSASQVEAGVVGGYPIGEGAWGMYAEFLGEGQLARDSLRAGGFASGGLGERKAESLVVLSSDGRSPLIYGRGIDDALAALAEAVDRGELGFKGSEVAGVRLQAPLFAGSGGLIGFSIVGSEPREVLVRGLGPSFPRTGAADPWLEIYRLESGVALGLAPSDDWREGAQFAGDGDGSQGAHLALEEGFRILGLSDLDDAARDSAQRVWLSPGDYVLVARLARGADGAGLVELFGL